MRIAVLDDYAGAFERTSTFDKLLQHAVTIYRDTATSEAGLIDRLQDAEAVVLTQERSALRRSVIERLPKLKLVAQSGSHRGHIDIEACTQHGVAIAALGGGGMSYSTAELTWGLILAALRHIPYEAEQLKRGAWQSTTGTQLRGKTLGIYALGRIGSTVAQIGQAFGMNVMCWGREASRAHARDVGYAVPDSRAAFFSSADVVSVHIHFNAETRGLITLQDLLHMKPSALFVNTSRAALIEPGALVSALQQGRPGYAAIDVFENEPVIGGTHPLLALPNVLCTPHLGYAVDTQFERFYTNAIAHILAFAAGAPINIINPEALER